MPLCMYECTYVFMYEFMYACMYACMYVRIYVIVEPLSSTLAKCSSTHAQIFVDAGTKSSTQDDTGTTGTSNCLAQAPVLHQEQQQISRGPCFVFFVEQTRQRDTWILSHFARKPTKFMNSSTFPTVRSCLFVSSSGSHCDDFRSVARKPTKFTDSSNFPAVRCVLCWYLQRQ